MRVAYDFNVNEAALQEHLLAAHGKHGDVVVPFGLARAFTALADLRRNHAVCAGLYPDALGLIGEADQLALLELKHPNHWKTASGALFQVFAYASWLKRRVEHGVGDFVDSLSTAFATHEVTETRLFDAVTSWRNSCKEGRPLGDLVLICVVVTNRSWENVLPLFDAYGINLRAVTSSVLKEIESNRACAISWFEIDPQAEGVAPNEAFRWDVDELRFLAEHPAARLAHLPGAAFTRSSRDFTIRISRCDTLVAVATPMTGDNVLVEVTAADDPSRWRPFLIGCEDAAPLAEVESTISASLRAVGSAG